jgi:citrate synthase
MTWETAITAVKKDEIRVRGYSQTELMTESTFGDVAYLALSGELPTLAEAAVFDAILIACIDHSVTPPSAQAARLATGGGASVPAAIASGLLTIGSHHGGAMLELQRVLETIVAEADGAAGIESRAAEAVEEYRDAGDRVPGFGHRVHAEDPRAKVLLDLLKATDLDGDHLRAFESLGTSLTELIGRELSPNVDGAAAVCLAELGFDATIAQAVFVIGRAVGLAAHVQEERTTERPMRDVGPEIKDISYVGPDPREVPDWYAPADDRS